MNKSSSLAGAVNGSSAKSGDLAAEIRATSVARQELEKSMNSQLSTISQRLDGINSSAITGQAGCHDLRRLVYVLTCMLLVSYSFHVYQVTRLLKNTRQLDQLQAQLTDFREATGFATSGFFIASDGRRYKYTQRSRIVTRYNGITYLEVTPFGAP